MNAAPKPTSIPEERAAWCGTNRPISVGMTIAIILLRSPMRKPYMSAMLMRHRLIFGGVGVVDVVSSIVLYIRVVWWGYY